eukprot:CAMPEP_0173370952 /NCGR_PEP_ID=MMETSP1144-20121109/27001_1 /TAXON_ID=483371 /ORGANISM="non described non described, Strain CCMP2298" /LENGTH=41 /DNA_ID=CAMNT_0014322619 /DNA_START=66 /DNA_END=187 /DNA_ORIENTATION=+
MSSMGGRIIEPRRRSLCLRPWVARFFSIAIADMRPILPDEL